MKGISRQVIGFAIGAIFLVIVILIFAYFLSGLTSIEVRANNIQYFHWFEGGISEAWTKSNWADTVPHELKNDGDKNYYTIFVPNYTAETIKSYFSGSNKSRISYTLSSCIAPDSLCMCLIMVDGSCFSGGMIKKSPINWRNWGQDVIDCLDNHKDSFEVVECKNMMIDGFYYKDNSGSINFPKIISGDKQVFGIGSDLRSGFEIDKWKNQLNITEATS